MHRKEVQALECRILQPEEELAQVRRNLKTNTRLKAQPGLDHETSSIPSSKGIRHKKITKSRERTGRKPRPARP